MPPPANIRYTANAPFPSLVTGINPIVVSKVNGIWTIAFGGSGTAATIITAAGDVTVGGLNTILMNKTVGAATNILLPASASHNGPVSVKDYKGDANVNHITFVPNGTETIDGLSGAAAIANGIAVIDTSYGAKTLYPLAGGWYVL